MKEKTTSKKQKFVRSKTFVDAETGEAIPFMEVSVEDRDFNFHKVWLQHMINALDSVSNQKLRLAFWIIDNLNRDNQLVMTQRKIAEKSGKNILLISSSRISVSPMNASNIGDIFSSLNSDVTLPPKCPDWKRNRKRFFSSMANFIYLKPNDNRGLSSFSRSFIR